MLLDPFNFSQLLNALLLFDKKLINAAELVFRAVFMHFLITISADLLNVCYVRLFVSATYVRSRMTAL